MGQTLSPSPTLIAYADEPVASLVGNLFDELDRLRSENILMMMTIDDKRNDWKTAVRKGDTNAMSVAHYDQTDALTRLGKAVKLDFPSIERQCRGILDAAKSNLRNG